MHVCICIFLYMHVCTNVWGTVMCKLCWKECFISWTRNWIHAWFLLKKFPIVLIKIIFFFTEIEAGYERSFCYVCFNEHNASLIDIEYPFLRFILSTYMLTKIMCCLNRSWNDESSVLLRSWFHEVITPCVLITDQDRWLTRENVLVGNVQGKCRGGGNVEWKCPWECMYMYATMYSCICVQLNVCMAFIMTSQWHFSMGMDGQGNIRSKRQVIG